MFWKDFGISKILNNIEMIYLSFLLLLSSTSSTCSYYISRYSASYDLSPLANNGQLPYYVVSDAYYTNQARSFSYYFDVCGGISQTLPICNRTDHAACLSINLDGTCEKNKTIDSTNAFQINKNCFYLSDADRNDSMIWSLLDGFDPSQGVVLTYQNGDWCPKYQRNRELNLRFQCENDAFNVPDSETIIESDCIYNMTLKSIYGCPIQCGTYSNQLCNSKGLCAYDYTNESPRCFCYDKYSGSACQTYQSSSSKLTQTSKKPPMSPYLVNLPITYSGGLMNISYDLSVFHLKNGYYNVSDSDPQRTDTEYYFNVHDNINSMASIPQCSNVTGPCNGNDCKTVNYGAVYQYNRTSGICHLLGSNANYNISLLDSYNPAKGMILGYVDGGYCAATGSNRRFSITFQCPQTQRSTYNVTSAKSFSDFVEEDNQNQCSYSMTWVTPLACPYQCITTSQNKNSHMTNYSVCSGRGICAADTEAGFVRCLCDSGYTGNDCSQIENSSSSSSDNHTAFTVTILVICILLVILMGVVVYLYYRNKSLKELTTHLMKTGEYEDGVPETLIAEPTARLPNHESESESESEEEQNNKNSSHQNFEHNRKEVDNEMVDITGTLRNDGNKNNNDNKNNQNDNNNDVILAPPSNQNTGFSQQTNLLN